MGKRSVRNLPTFTSFILLHLSTRCLIAEMKFMNSISKESLDLQTVALGGGSEQDEKGMGGRGNIFLTCVTGSKMCPNLELTSSWKEIC